MKFRNVFGCLLLSTIIGSTLSHANSDLCFNLPGPWEGDATIHYTIRNNHHCEYDGIVEITVPLSDRHHFTAKTTLRSQTRLCLPSVMLTFRGVCDGETGEVSIISNEANLHGSTNGSHLSLQGTMNINILNQIITMDVERFELNKR